MIRSFKNLISSQNNGCQIVSSLIRFCIICRVVLFENCWFNSFCYKEMYKIHKIVLRKSMFSINGIVKSYLTLHINALYNRLVKVQIYLGNFHIIENVFLHKIFQQKKYRCRSFSKTIRRWKIKFFFYVSSTIYWNIYFLYSLFFYIENIEQNIFIFVICLYIPLEKNS